MFKSFRPLLQQAEKAAIKSSSKTFKVHLQKDSEVLRDSQLNKTGKSQFGKVREEFVYPQRSKIADAVHKGFLFTVVGGSLGFLFMILSSIPLNINKEEEFKEKEERARQIRAEQKLNKPE
ncbi:hypothetical protein ACO0SA_003380 [Hanseniaspora valbyensis]